MKNVVIFFTFLFWVVIGKTQHVGIGIASPATLLHIKDTVSVPPGITPAKNLLYITRAGQNGTKSDMSFGLGMGSYATGMNAQTRVDLLLGNGASNVPDATIMTLLGNGNVGIGTTNPQATMDINGSTKTSTLQITSGAGANKILQSDASGNATWVSPSAAGLMYNYITATASNAIVSTSYVQVADLSVTPVAGTYYVSININCSIGSSSAIATFALLANGSLLTGVERSIQTSSGQQEQISLQTVVTANGTDPITVQAKTSTSTLLNVVNRSMVLIKL